MFSKYVQWRLERYVKKYFKKHNPKLIVVVGSVGKTTTKNAIGSVLFNKYRVQIEPGNLNTPLSVPLAIMGVKYPPVELVHKVKTWRHVFAAMKKRVKDDQGVDVIVQELGTDKPGDLAVFGRYLRPDIAIVTAVSPEHMENFPDGLPAVAREELSVAEFSNLTIINADDVDSDYSQYVNTENITDYGIENGEYRVEVLGGSPISGYEISLIAPGVDPNQARTTVHVAGEHMLKAVCAAATVGFQTGISLPELLTALSNIHPVPGRMNPLQGKSNTVVIDDTYNSSPDAAIAALKTLYQIEAPQRIAVLGNMNELGNFSGIGHQQVGQYCNGEKLDWVITIGDMAAQYLAPAAHKAGCQVKSFASPIEAGTFAEQVSEPGAAILVKGSQNNVYAEEATKVLLAHASDFDKLVRQDESWMEKKRTWFAELLNKQVDLDEE